VKQKKTSCPFDTASGGAGLSVFGALEMARKWHSKLQKVGHPKSLPPVEMSKKKINYPPVNVDITMERSTIFTKSTISMSMFNSFLYVYQRLTINH
jgi:hypothetical protein